MLVWILEKRNVRQEDFSFVLVQSQGWGFNLELGILVLYHECLSFGCIVLRWEMGTSANDQLLIGDLKLSFEIV